MGGEQLFPVLIHWLIFWSVFDLVFPELWISKEVIQVNLCIKLSSVIKDTEIQQIIVF